MYKYILIMVLSVLSTSFIKGQDDLMDMLDSGEETVDYTYATFKTTRIINSHSIENPATGVLLFMIQHRFGAINLGWYELWGLDVASIRFGFEYGLFDWLSLGFGRSSYEKTYDGFLKFRLLRQSSGARNMPFTLSYYVNTAITSLKWEDTDRTNYFSSRVSYTHHVLIARKFSNSLSLQLMPTLIHKNLVKTTEDHNDIFSIGVGGRFKITNRMSINAEYYYVPNGQIIERFKQFSYKIYQPFSIGLDLETGGHVFQLHFSNAKAFFEEGFVTEVPGRWVDGDIYFGFGISRVFTIKKPKTLKE